MEERRRGRREALQERNIFRPVCGFSMNLFTGNGPWGFDAHIKVALKFRHDVSKEQKQKPDSQHNGYGHGQGARSESLCQYNSVHDQHKDLHQNTEGIIVSAEFVIILSARINLRENIEEKSKQRI